MEVSEVIVIDKKIDLDTVMGSYLATFRESNQTSLALAERYALNGKLAVVGKFHLVLLGNILLFHSKVWELSF